MLFFLFLEDTVPVTQHQGLEMQFISQLSTGINLLLLQKSALNQTVQKLDWTFKTSDYGLYLQRAYKSFSS